MYKYFVSFLYYYYNRYNRKDELYPISLFIETDFYIEKKEDIEKIKILIQTQGFNIPNLYYRKYCGDIEEFRYNSSNISLQKIYIIGFTLIEAKENIIKSCISRFSNLR